MTESSPPISTASLQYTTSDLEDLKGLTNYYFWIYQEMHPFLGSTLAEVGAGIGNFTKVLIDNYVVTSSASIVAYEPAQNLFLRLKDLIEKQRPDLIRSDKIITSNSFFSNSTKYDTIILINVLEHIENDAGFIREARKFLISSGRLILFVPAIPWLYSELDKEVGHYRRYTKEKLMNLLQEEGFKIQKAIYMDFLGILPWYILNVTGKSKSFNPYLANLYDKLGVPITKRLEKVWPPNIGKNLLIIGQKSK